MRSSVGSPDTGNRPPGWRSKRWPPLGFGAAVRLGCRRFQPSKCPCRPIYADGLTESSILLPIRRADWPIMQCLMRVAQLLVPVFALGALLSAADDNHERDFLSRIRRLTV